MYKEENYHPQRLEYSAMPMLLFSFLETGKQVWFDGKADGQNISILAENLLEAEKDL